MASPEDNRNPIKFFFGQRTLYKTALIGNKRLEAAAQELTIGYSETAARSVQDTNKKNRNCCLEEGVPRQGQEVWSGKWRCGYIYFYTALHLTSGECSAYNQKNTQSTTTMHDHIQHTGCSIYFMSRKTCGVGKNASRIIDVLRATRT